MPVAFDAGGTVQTGAAVSGATGLSDTSLTVGTGTKRALVYGVYFNGISSAPGGVSAVWDSGGTNQSMNLLDTVGSTLGTLGFVAVYGLLNPTSGNKTFKISGWSGTENLCVLGASFTAVSAVGNNTAQTRNTTSNTATANNACTSTAIDAVFGFATSQTDTTTWTSISGTTIAQGGATSCGAAFGDYSLGSSPSFIASGTANANCFWAVVSVSLSGIAVVFQPTFQVDIPQRQIKDWSTYTFSPQTFVAPVFGGATNVQDVPQTSKRQVDGFAFHSPFVGTATPTSFPYQLQIDTPQLPKKDWSTVVSAVQPFVAQTPSSFGYQLQQDRPQLPKQQKDAFAFHSPFGLYVPSFSWQLQQDVPQLPKKQWDQFAFFALYNPTPTVFSYQLQQDIPQLPKKQWDGLAFHSPFVGTSNPQTWGSFQIQQDLPQPPKQQWDLITSVTPVGVVTPSTFGSFTNHPDVPQLPKKQWDLLAQHSPFLGTRTQTAFPYQHQQDIPQYPKKQWDALFVPFGALVPITATLNITEAFDTLTANLTVTGSSTDFTARYGPSFFIDTVMIRRDDSPPKNEPIIKEGYGPD